MARPAQWQPSDQQGLYIAQQHNLSVEPKEKLPFKEEELSLSRAQADERIQQSVKSFCALGQLSQVTFKALCVGIEQ